MCLGSISYNSVFGCKIVFYPILAICLFCKIVFIFFHVLFNPSSNLFRVSFFAKILHFPCIFICRNCWLCCLSLFLFMGKHLLNTTLFAFKNYSIWFSHIFSLLNLLSQFSKLFHSYSTFIHFAIVSLKLKQLIVSGSFFLLHPSFLICRM